MFEKPEPIIGDTKEKQLDMEKLPAVEVKNKVIFVNPAIHAPFKLEEGKPSKLGLFLKPKTKKPELNFIERIVTRFIKPKEEKQFNLGTMSGHGRSAILGRVVFDDDERRMYRDIDLKGIGRIIPKMDTVCVGEIIEKIGEYSNEAKEAYGLLRLSSAYHDKDMSEAFLAAGIRTHRVIAIISLSEMIDNTGNRIKVEDAQKLNIIPESVKPVISVRAYGTKYRLDEFVGQFKELGSNLKPEMKSDILNDAMTIVAQELGKNPEEFSKIEYLEWLAATIGQGVGRMHKNGWYHAWLLTHNITLDGRITDLDSVGWLNKTAYPKRNIFNDYRNMINVLENFVEKIGLKAQTQQIIDIAKKAYNQEFSLAV